LHGPAGDAAEIAAATTAVAAVLGGVWGQPVEHTWVHWVVAG
jgi:ABC-type transport system involved in cytochrome c biogenesis permease subunit